MQLHKYEAEPFSTLMGNTEIFFLYNDF